MAFANEDNYSDALSETDDDMLEEDCVIRMMIGATSHYNRFLHKVPCHIRPFSGWASLMDMINCENDRRCYENLRMEKHVFLMLCQTLVDDYGLEPMRSVTVEEQVATLLMIVGTREGNRQLQETLQRSGFTISKSFHRVLTACTKMSVDWIKPFDDNSCTHPKVRNDSRYYPYFKDCIGAIDGTHVPAKLPKGAQIPFIGRKGYTTQNVMAVCDFDLCFTFVLAGWEGSAHDTRIFHHALRQPTLNFPKPTSGKYYVVDAGYPNTEDCLSPFKGQKYHLPDFQRATFYNNHFEAFNHAHSSLRSCVERAFGVWKNKFYIMKDMPIGLKYSDQVALVAATMAIHNFICKKHFEDEDFQKYGEIDDEDEDDNGGGIINRGPEFIRDDRNMDKVRDDICTLIAFSRIGVPTT